MDLNHLALAVATQLKSCNWNPEDLFYQVKANYHEQLIDFARNLVINALAISDPEQIMIDHHDQKLTYQGQSHQILLFVDQCQSATQFLFPTKTKKIKSWFVVCLTPNQVQLHQATYEQVFAIKSAKQWLKAGHCAYQSPHWNQFRDRFYQWFNQLQPVFVHQQLLSAPVAIANNEQSLILVKPNPIVNGNQNSSKPKPPHINNQNRQNLNQAELAMSAQLEQIVHHQIDQGDNDDQASI